MMRSTKKSELVDIFIEKYGLNTKTDGIVLYTDHVVIDGGALLHRVPWGGSTKDPITVSVLFFPTTEAFRLSQLSLTATKLDSSQQSNNSIPNGTQ